MKTTSRLSAQSVLRPLVRADSAFYGAEAVNAVLRGGADISVAVRMDAKVKATIATIGDDAWTTIDYTDAVFDEATSRWVSRAEVAEIEFTASTSKKKADHVTGRLVAAASPDLNPAAKNGQETLFDAQGKALPGAITITDPNGVTSVDGRNTTDLPQFKGTDYQRPEDLQLQTVKGVERLYVATTTTNEVYALDLRAQEISVFATRAITDLATGVPVGAGLAGGPRTDARI